MGCDIHMYVEIKKGKDWYNVDYFRRGYNNGDVYYHVPIYDSRNYALFATLANVRNYGNTEYIDEPRGLPEDMTDYVRLEWDDTWYWDGHSCSYLTLQELIDFHNKGVKLKRKGMIGPEAQKALDEDGILPTTWCQATNQVGWEFREWEEENEVLVPLINKLKERADELSFIYDFSWDGNEEARKRAYEASKNIRIVFWFDN